MICVYCWEIYYVYVVICDWLVGDLWVDVLDVLMVCFVEDFLMVMLYGVVLDKIVLGELFCSKGGICFGLCIEIDGESLLVLGVDGVILVYWEIQFDVVGCSECLFIVVLYCDDEGWLYWCYLQEIFCG